MTKNFSRMLVVAMAVVLVAELGARALQPQLPPLLRWDSPFAQAKAEAAPAIGRVDVAIVGSSIGNANLDPPLIIEGIPWATSGYNAALPAEAPRQWEVWLADVVLPDLCPSLVVVAVGPRDTNDNKADTERAVEQYRASAGRLALYGIATTETDVEDSAAQWSALIAIRSRLREPGNLIRYLQTGSAPGWPSVRLTDEGRYLGFDDDPTYERVTERNRDLRRGAMSGYEVGPAEFGALARIIERVRETGASVVLIDMPYMRTELARVVDDGEADLDRYHERLASLARELEVPLLDYPDFMNDPSLYADHYHMVGVGSAALSEAVGTDLGLLFPDGLPVATCAERDPDALP